MSCLTDFPLLDITLVVPFLHVPALSPDCVRVDFGCEMAKVKQKVAKQGAAGASTRGAQISKQKKHKIAVQGDPRDKKLPTVVRKKSARVLAKSGFKTRLPDPQKIAFTDEPPPGYTFITAGNPELTNALKEFALRADQKIFVVTVS